MGCHIYIESLRTGKDYERVTWVRLPPAYYDAEFSTEAEVRVFVHELITGTWPCTAERKGWTIEECCEPESCRERYSFTPNDVDWILKKFKEGVNKIVCG